MGAIPNLTDMSVKLGIAPIAWSNDDMPELGGETSLDQCLSEASEAGFIGIESGGKFPKTSNELLPKLEKYKLNLCSGWYGANLRDNSVEEEKKLFFFLNAVVSKICTIPSRT